MSAPVRAFRLTLRLDADSRDDIASALRRLADDVERDELTVGCSGAPHDGAIYELLHDPEMTHERYFTELREYLDQQRVQQPVAALEPQACMVCGEHHGNGLPCPRMAPTAGGA